MFLIDKEIRPRNRIKPHRKLLRFYHRQIRSARFIPGRNMHVGYMHERYIRWWTPHMSRDFEMLVFGHGRGLPLILFPTSFGRHTQNKDFGLTDACAPFVDAGKITIYCPDSADLDSFY